MITVYGIQVNEEQGLGLQPMLLRYVSPERQRQVTRYRRPFDGHRSLMGDILSRLAICSGLQVQNEKLHFGKNEFGKPLLDDPPGYHFNVSHSGDWVVCVFADHLVGIDIERIKSIEYSIAERFFAPTEFGDLMGKPGDQKLTYFYQLWTLKESYIKAVGRGLSIPLNSFCFNIGEDGQISVQFEDEAFRFYFYQNFVGESHIMSLCSLRNETPQVKYLDYRSLRDLLSLLDSSDNRII